MNKLIFSVVITFATIQFLHAQEFGHGFVKDFGSSDWETIAATVIDPDNNAYICGSFTGTLALAEKNTTSKGKRDIFLAKIDKTGEVLWLKNYGGNYDDNAYSLIYNDGFLYLAGSFKKEIELKTGEAPLKTEGFTDVFLAKLDTEGAVQWARAIKSKSAAQKAILQKTSDKNIWIAGTYKKALTAGNSTLDEAQKTDIYYASYSPAGDFNGIWHLGGNDEKKLYDFKINTNDEFIFAGSFEGEIALTTPSITATAQSLQPSS